MSLNKMNPAEQVTLNALENQTPDLPPAEQATLNALKNQTLDLPPAEQATLEAMKKENAERRKNTARRVKDTGALEANL